MLLESRICGYRDGFWAETGRFGSGVRQELAAWRSIFPRHLLLIFTLVRPLLIPFRRKASRSIRKNHPGRNIQSWFDASLRIPRRSWNCETRLWISRRFCGSLCGHFRRYEVLPKPRGFCQRRRLSDSRYLERWLKEPHAAVEAIDCVCPGCGTGLRDCEAQACCRLSLQR
jgi:hypothetical protein